MRVHYFQHVPFEGLGSMASWFEKHYITVSKTLFYEENFQFPDLKDFDVLVVMGGPMGVYEDHLYPFLNAEKAFIKSAIELGKGVLGVCLGAQLIAAALNQKVYANDGIKEIGWFPVRKVGNHAVFQDFPETLKVLHWHGDTFDLPIGAELIFSTEKCRNQAFVYQNNVVALQFHLEANQKALRGFLDNCSAEVEQNKEQKTVQSVAEIEKLENTVETNLYMDKILQYFKEKFA